MQMDRLSSAEFDKMIIESIDEVYCFDKETDDLLFFFDQIKSGEITSESDVVYAEGRQGVQLAAFDRNKTAGFTCENGYVQAGAIAVQLGSDLKNGTTSYEVMETLDSATSGTPAAPTGVFTLSETPTSVTGVYLLGEDGTASKRLASTAYSLSTKTLTVSAITTYEVDNTTGTYYLVNGEYTTTEPESTYAGDMYKAVSTYPSKVLVHYVSSTATGKKIINAGDKFSKNIKLVINFVAQDPCGGSKYLMQCVMPNAKASGTFSLSAGDDPAVHNFEASALLDVCSVDKELFYIVMV